MFAESHPLVRRFVRFMMLPYCFIKLNWKECRKNPIGVMTDFLYLFFNQKTFPDNYGPCRLWEIQRSNWKYYYGSSYHPYQRERLRKRVQRFEYQILFNDKSVCEQLCKGIDVALPVTVGILWCDGDYRKQLEMLLKQTTAEKLIVKPMTGHAGMGIVLAYREDNGTIYINAGSKKVPLGAFLLSEDAIVQELLVQDRRIAQISSSSVNTIRVVTMYDKKDDVVIVSATARFSARSNAFVDNWSAGGIAVGVNCIDGTLMKYGYDKKGNRNTMHPVSKVIFEGFQIPVWDQILAAARKVQSVFPFYRLLGMDLAIREDGVPVLVEVNANADLIFQEQTSGPLLAIPEVLKAFKEYDLLVTDEQRRLPV